MNDKIKKIGEHVWAGESRHFTYTLRPYGNGGGYKVWFKRKATGHEREWIFARTFKSCVARAKDYDRQADNEQAALLMGARCEQRFPCGCELYTRVQAATYQL